MSSLIDFSEYVRDTAASWHCPGVAVSVIKDEELLHQSVHGWRDAEDELPMTADTRFPIASITKSFTAMSVALLVDDGKLEWDKPVRDYIPEFILKDSYATEHVTVRDMLAHRTGLPRHDLAAWRMDLPLGDFILRLRHLEFNLSFREHFQYNNLMYYAIAYLVEKLAGQPWEEFVHERILAPLGMAASSFAPQPPKPDQVTAAGYRVDRDEEGAAKGLIRLPFGEHSRLSPGAAGTIFSTLADLTQWLRVHVNEGRLGDHRLVSPENLKQMHLPQIVMPGGGITEALLGNTVCTYAMGWSVEPYRDHTLVHHSGGVEGHSLIVGFLPQERVGLVVLTNIGGLPVPQALLYEAIDRALGLDARDWNARFHTTFDPLIAAEARGKQTAAAERVTDAPPTHPLEACAGVYEADGYPDFAVELDGTDLRARTVGSLDWSELRHYHYNVFEWHIAAFDQWVKVRFQVNDSGEVDSVSVPMEPTVDNISFTRKQPELSEQILAALAGEYESPVAGLSFAVAVRDGKVYVAQSGEAPAEVKARTLTAGIVGFKMEGVRLDFVRDGQAISRLVIKAPGMTLEAPRRQAR